MDLNLETIPMPVDAISAVADISGFIGRGMHTFNATMAVWGAPRLEEWCQLVWSDKGMEITLTADFYRSSPTAYFAVVGFAKKRNYQLVEMMERG